MGCDNSKAYVTFLQSELEASRSEARRNREELDKSKQVIQSLLSIRTNTLSQLTMFEQQLDEEWAKELPPEDFSSDDCCSIDTLSSQGCPPSLSLEAD